jgi:GNAT superfamily N-acetyltransferase
MATLQRLQGQGVGALLVEAGCARASAGGAHLVWANARDAALGFYLRHGFVVDSEGFIEAVTELPHHVIVRMVDRTGT